MKSDSKEISRALELYGLTQNEAKVYVCLLKQVESTAFTVAKETEIPRATVYTILESLKKQGLISQIRKNNVAYFTPESTNQLVSALKKKEDIINEIMPQIQALTPRSVDAPVVKLYVGLDGIKTGLDHILETLKKRKIKQIYATSQPDLLKYMPKYFPDWLKKREEMGVFTNLILPHTTHEYLESNKWREVRYLPDAFPFSSSVTIYGKTMAFFSLRENDPYCVIIESSSIVDMLKQFFLFTWEMLKTAKS